VRRYDQGVDADQWAVGDGHFGEAASSRSTWHRILNAAREQHT
jgi:hypothetical protein